MNKQVFLVKVKKSEGQSNSSVPFHPELEFVRQVSTIWIAHDTKTKKEVEVTRTEKGKYVEYAILGDAVTG